MVIFVITQNGNTIKNIPVYLNLIIRSYQTDDALVTFERDKGEVVSVDFQVGSGIGRHSSSKRLQCYTQHINIQFQVEIVGKFQNEQ